MKNNKYRFNTKTYQYEKIKERWYHILLKWFAYVSTVTVFAGIIILLAFQFLDSPDEKLMSRELVQMELQFEQLSAKLEFYEEVLQNLEGRDSAIYRTIFEAPPPTNQISDIVSNSPNINYTNTSNIVQEVTTNIETMGKRLYQQSKSYDEIAHLVQNKAEMLACLPAIQPVANKNLKRIASGFGMRMHPIYKTRKMHAGIDFSAPSGTNIYATAKGKVTKVSKMKRGYGNHIVIDHGFNYKTQYAHLKSIKVKKGQQVNRGDIIGTVGNTGLSVAPHLHYEVIKNGKKVNPINFFFNDLSAKEYEEIVRLASRHNQTFD